MQLHPLVLFPLAAAVNLYVAGRQNITTLSFDPNTLELRVVATHQGCAPEPSWLLLDPTNKDLYCVDDNTSTNGSVSVYTASPDGILTQKQRVSTPTGPVSATFYADRGGARGLVTANYHSRSISSYQVPASEDNNAKLEQLEVITYPLPLDPTGNPRQAEPHPHQAILDTSGFYLLIPDLGADLISVYTWNSGIGRLDLRRQLMTGTGCGPRHVAFWTRGEPADMWGLLVVCELSNELVNYEIVYIQGTEKIEFLGIERISSVVGTVRPGSQAAEVLVSPDGRFVTISNRNDRSAPNGDDSLVTYELGETGELKLVQVASAGGYGPRHFSWGGNGEWVAVGLQGSEKVVVLERDVASGKIGGVVAQVEVQGSPACVIWDE